MVRTSRQSVRPGFADPALSSAPMATAHPALLSATGTMTAATAPTRKIVLSSVPNWNSSASRTVDAFTLRGSATATPTARTEVTKTRLFVVRYSIYRDKIV